MIHLMINQNNDILMAYIKDKLSISLITLFTLPQVLLVCLLFAVHLLLRQSRLLLQYCELQIIYF